MTDADRDVRRVSRRELMEGGLALGVTAVASQYAVGDVMAQSGGPSDVISGTVTDGNGAVEGATVVAVPHDQSLDALVTTTASDGSYSFEDTDLHGGENLYHVIARDGTETSPRRGQENYPFIAAEGIDIPDSAILHWPHDEGSGTTLAETVDTYSGQDGTINGATWTANSSWWEGQYLDYDGTDDGTRTGQWGTFGSAVLPNAFTIIIEASMADEDAYMVASNGDGTNDEDFFAIGPSDYATGDAIGQMGLLYDDRTGGNALRIRTDDEYADGTRHFFAVQMENQDVSTARWYVDNGFVPVSTQDQGVTMQDFSVDVGFGAIWDGDTFSQHLNCNMGRVLVCDSYLSQSQLDELAGQHGFNP